MTWNLVVLDSFFTDWHMYPFDVQEIILDQVDSLGTDPLQYVAGNADALARQELRTTLVIRINGRSWTFLVVFRISNRLKTVTILRLRRVA